MSSSWLQKQKKEKNNNNKQHVKQDGTKRIKEVRAEEINMAVKEEREGKKQQGKKVFMFCKNLERLLVGSHVKDEKASFFQGR